MRKSGLGCSKLTMTLVKISNVNISNTPIFLLKKCEKLLQCKKTLILFLEKMTEAFAMQKLLSFFQQKISV